LNVVKIVRFKHVAVALAMWVAGVAVAQEPLQPGALCPPCLHDQVLSSLPASVELVVAVNNGARQRATPAGKSFVGMMAESAVWSETTRAWAVLAHTLEWTPERTFDELLGKRVSLVARGLNSPEGADWAVLSAVSRETQARLRARLNAAPRGAIAGLSVLSIEDGSFQFVVAPCLDAAARGEEGSVILLAPRRSESLLDDLAPVLRGTGASPEVALGKPCDVVVALRGERGGERSLAITATAVDGGWDAGIVCTPAYLFDRPLPAGPTRAWSDSAFRELESGSLLAVMSVASGDSFAFLPEQVRSWKQALAGLTGAGAADAEHGGLRTGVFVRTSAPAVAVRAVAASRYVPEDHPTPEAPRGRLAVTLLSESRDSRATLVNGDRAMIGVARMLMTGKADAGPTEPKVQFELLDRGPRLLCAGEDFQIHPDIEPSITRVFGESSRLSWLTLERRDGAAWWVGSISGTEGAGSRELRVLAAPEKGTAKPRLSVGMIRPAALRRWVDAVDPALLGPMEGAAFVESIRWDAFLRTDGHVEANVQLRMVTPRTR